MHPFCLFMCACCHPQVVLVAAHLAFSGVLHALLAPTCTCLPSSSPQVVPAGSYHAALAFTRALLLFTSVCAVLPFSSTLLLAAGCSCWASLQSGCRRAQHCAAPLLLPGSWWMASTPAAGRWRSCCRSCSCHIWHCHTPTAHLLYWAAPSSTAGQHLDRHH